MDVFLKGLAIGLAISIPVGPVGLLCIRRSIVDGRLVGLATGLGAATADAFYGLLAALGTSALTSLLEAHRGQLQLAGGLFLTVFGIVLFQAKLKPREQLPSHSPSLRSAYFSTVALTLANPVTIVAFVGIFSGLSVVTEPGANISNAMLVAGVFSGSALWWLILSTGANSIAGHINATVIKAISRIGGAGLAGFGVATLIGLIVGR